MKTERTIVGAALEVLKSAEGIYTGINRSRPE